MKVLSKTLSSPFSPLEKLITPTASEGTVANSAGTDDDLPSEDDLHEHIARQARNTRGRKNLRIEYKIKNFFLYLHPIYKRGWRNGRRASFRS